MHTDIRLFWACHLIELMLVGFVGRNFESSVNCFTFVLNSNYLIIVVWAGGISHWPPARLQALACTHFTIKHMYKISCQLFCQQYCSKTICFTLSIKTIIFSPTAGRVMHSCVESITQRSIDSRVESYISLSDRVELSQWFNPTWVKTKLKLSQGIWPTPLYIFCNGSVASVYTGLAVCEISNQIHVLSKLL